MPVDLTTFEGRASLAPGLELGARPKRRGPMAFPTRVLKTALDRLGSATLLVLLAPLLATLALVLWATQGGPILFGHRRVGRDGTPFACLKFRTMRTDAAEMLQSILDSDPIAREEWTTTFKLENDPRVTRLGRWLRKTSLDELPQLWNVLKGDMSLVGPRPITESELGLYGAGAAQYKSIRPGLTGLWQVSGRSSLSYDERVALDLAYVRDISFVWDLQIIARTVFSVGLRRGAR